MKPALGSWLLALGGARCGALAARGMGVLASVVAAVAGLASQLLWIEELPSADKHAASQYRIVLATTCDQTPRVNSQELRAKSQEQIPPRILKPLADHWEAGARVHLDSADLPAPPHLPVFLDAELPQAPAAPQRVCAAVYPPGPLARGPPRTF